MAKARRPCEFELQWFVFGPDGKTAVGQKVVAALWDGTEEQQEVESLNLYDVVSVDGVAARRATFMRPDGSVTPYPNWRAKRCCCGGEADTHGRCYDCGGYNSDADASGFMGAFFV